MNIRLDVHAHLLPFGPADLSGIAGAEWHADGYAILDGTALRNRDIYDVRKLLAWMDAHGVEEAWISPPPTAYRAHLEEAPAQEWACRINAVMAACVQSHGRLRAMAHLPVYHPAVAAEVARHALADGQRLFCMPAGDARRGRMLSDEAYRPLWELLNDARAFLFLHPAGACDPRFSRFSLTNLLGGPVETAIAAAHLAMSGILERYEGITVCLAHGGGATAAAAGRMARGQDTGREGAYLGGKGVRQALQRLCVDCITHDVPSLQLVASTFGAGRVLFGSDWPFDMGLKEPAMALAGTPAELLERLTAANPAALLRQLQLDETKEPGHA